MSQNPQQFGKYTLVERIAVGGMAEIYRAKTYGAAGFEKDLVIKRILPQFSADDDFVKMFIDEARLAAKLQHANVVQIFDFDSAELPDGPSYYIAMELVEGKDVRHLLKEGIRRNLPMSLAMAVHVAVESLKGLHYAHTKAENQQPLNIVHRDVSPHNLLVSYSGEVKISDFGIAKAAARASATSNGMVKGKLAYMSPEQVTGQPLDRRTDVYSTGIVLYEMLTRTRLFAGSTDAEVITKVRDAVVPPLRQRNPQVPQDLEAVVMQMLTHDVRKRFQSGADAARALSQTSVYSATEAGPLGEYVAQLFPVQPRRDPPAAVAAAVRAAQEQKKMSDQRGQSGGGGPPASGKAPLDAATMMAEAPAADMIAKARAEAAAKAAAAKPAAPAPAPTAPAKASIVDQSTAILDSSSPAHAQIQKQIDAAIAAKAPPPSSAAGRITGPQAQVPAPKPASIMDQSTAILDSGSPAHAAIQKQIDAAIAAKAPPQSASAQKAPAASLMDQSTAILDSSSPAHAAMRAQIDAAVASRAGAPASTAGRGAPPPAAPPGPAANTGQATMMLEPGMMPQIPTRPSPQQQLQPLAPIAPVKPQSTAMRWVLGPAVMAATGVIVFFVAGAVLPAARVAPAPPKPKVIVKGRIQLKTSPPGAKITVDGKEEKHLTPTAIEGPVGDTVHIVVTLAGHKAIEQDILFAQEERPLTLSLDAEDERAPPKKEKEKLAKTEEPKEKDHGKDRDKDKDKEKDKDSEEKGDKEEHHHRSKGTVSIFVRPWAIVFVDGQRLRQTPIANYEIPSGKHTFKLVNDNLGKSENVTLSIKGGQSQEIRKEWQ